MSAAFSAPELQDFAISFHKMCFRVIVSFANPQCLHLASEDRPCCKEMEGRDPSLCHEGFGEQMGYCEVPGVENVSGKCAECLRRDKGEQERLRNQRLELLQSDEAPEIPDEQPFCQLPPYDPFIDTPQGHAQQFSTRQETAPDLDEMIDQAMDLFDPDPIDFNSWPYISTNSAFDNGTYDAAFQNFQSNVNFSPGNDITFTYNMGNGAPTLPTQPNDFHGLPELPDLPDNLESSLELAGNRDTFQGLPGLPFLPDNIDDLSQLFGPPQTSTVPPLPEFNNPSDTSLPPLPQDIVFSDAEWEAAFGPVARVHQRQHMEVQSANELHTRNYDMNVGE